MELERSYGVLLHITSLPGRYGSGTIGREAYSFIDLLADNGASYWQILPTGPVSGSMCFSPYSALSVFAGNEIFISTDMIMEKDWFRINLSIPLPRDSSVSEFSMVKSEVLEFTGHACSEFIKNASAGERGEYEKFCETHGSNWLDDYSLFMALSEKYGTHNWFEWEAEATSRDKNKLSELSDELSERIGTFRFAQFIFHQQWDELKRYANSKGIKIIGDIPIYMSMDSADAWVSRNIIEIDKKTLVPEAVAGVPPDYFSETGQLWGNPLYRWHDDTGGLNDETYNWWLRRLKHALSLTDLVRIDHFRGFESYWSVPFGEETAINGKWIKGPGEALFKRLARDIGDLPIIAEDLGVITPEVRMLRDNLSLPGMKVLLFAFDQNSDNDYLPHNITDKNCLVYTGTHDNDTANGWFYSEKMSQDDRDYILEYLAMKEWSDFHMRIIREAMATIADLVIIPAQDILGYGNEYRMNMPGTVKDNWVWKLRENELNSGNLVKIKRMAQIFSRVPERERSDK